MYSTVIVYIGTRPQAFAWSKYPFRITLILGRDRNYWISLDYFDRYNVFRSGLVFNSYGFHDFPGCIG